MLAQINAGVVYGLDGVPIEVEVDVASMGLPTFTIVGLPNKAIDESKDRVRTAIVNAGYEMPDSRLTVNLAPADLPKEGSSLDVPIAVGILASSGMIKPDRLSGSLFVGELALEGRVRRIPGVISVALMARRNKLNKLYIPFENVREAALIDGMTIYPVRSLEELVLHLNGIKEINPYPKVVRSSLQPQDDSEFNFAEIKGQEQAKRALEIAACGFHNIHLKGPPGSGKTMLSRAFPSILPPLSNDEVLELTKIYSVSGLLTENSFVTTRPFRSPHHTTSRIGLIGGGQGPRPGEISLAHRGVLFLDEFPEFPRSVLEALRQPLEDGHVTISRAQGSLTFPSRFLLAAASNPCPCGFLGHPHKSCKCMPGAIVKYRKRLSGPLLDRIDLHIDVPPVANDKLISRTNAESSIAIRTRVVAGLLKQHARFKESRIIVNSHMKSSDIRIYCKFTDDATTLLKQAISRLSLSARSYFKLIKVAQTIADIENKEKIEGMHIAEALQYRFKDN